MVENYRRELNVQLRRLWAIAYPGEVYRELRLPTDQEWQYVASEEEVIGGVHRQMELPGGMPTGTGWTRTVFDGPRSSQSAELGVHRGIRGLTGHIWQMTSTPYSGGHIVLRGGYWTRSERDCRSSIRYSDSVENRSLFAAPRFVRSLGF